MTRHRLWLFAFLFCLDTVLVPLIGCGGGGHKNNPPPSAQVTLSSIAVSPSTATFAIGTNQAFTANGKYSDGTSKDVTAAVQWSATDSTIVWLNNAASRKGLATARVAGSTTLKAMLSGVTGTASATVTALTPRFGYVANQADGTLSNFVLDAGSGAMRAGEYLNLGPARPVSSVTHPTGKFMYVLDGPSNAVLAYSVDVSTGELSRVAGSPFAGGGSGASALAMDRVGKYLLIANATSGSVSVFDINSSSGALSAVSGSPFVSGGGTAAVASDPTAKFVYAANTLDNTVSAFAMGASGALTKVSGSPFATGQSPASLAADATGQYLYVANANSNNVSGFVVDAATGALTAIPGSPFTTGEAPSSLALAPGGEILFIANRGTSADDYAGTISSFEVNSDTGVLTAVSGSPHVGRAPKSIVVDPSGNLLYVMNQESNDAWTFHINHANGTLNLLQTTRTRVAPASMSIVGGESAVTMKPTFAYAAGPANANIAVYSVNAPTGELAEIQGSPFTTSGASISVAVHPSQKFIYVANYWNYKLSAYTADSKSGALTEIAGSPYAFPSVNSGPYMVQVEPSGRFLYMTNGYDLLAGMVINQETGSLTPASWQPIKISSDAPWGPDGFVIDPTGRFLYVADSSMVSISGFEIDPEGGSLQELAGSPFKYGPLGSYPQALQIDPTGKFLYMPLRCANWSTNCATNALHGFVIDPDDGHLTALQGSPWETPFTDLVSIAMDAGGRFLYIVDGGGANVQTSKGTHAFSVDPMTGQPTRLTTGFPFQPAAVTFLSAAPIGGLLYGGNISANLIETYAVDASTGALTNKQAFKFSVGGAPWSVAFTHTLE